MYCKLGGVSFIAARTLRLGSKPELLAIPQTPKQGYQRAWLRHGLVGAADDPW